jgi:hypothetical protein
LKLSSELNFSSQPVIGWNAGPTAAVIAHVAMPGREPSIGKKAGDRALVRGFAERDFCQLLAEVCGGARVSSAIWREVNACPPAATSALLPSRA